MKPKNVIDIKTKLGIKFVNTANIVYITTANKHTIVTLEINLSFEAFHPINWFEQLLSSREFCRCHNSYIINCRFIDYLNLKTSEIILINNLGSIPFSRKLKPNIYDTIKNMYA